MEAVEILPCRPHVPESPVFLLCSLCPAIFRWGNTCLLDKTRAAQMSTPQKQLPCRKNIFPAGAQLTKMELNILSSTVLNYLSIHFFFILHDDTICIFHISLFVLYICWFFFLLLLYKALTSWIPMFLLSIFI